ncbi:MAG: SPFH domain-containing protein, partial [Ornithinibacter sp.]
MQTFPLALIVISALVGLMLTLAVRVIKQFEQGVLFRLGKLQGTRAPGLRMIIPAVDVMHRVSLRIVTLPIQSQGIITR